MMFIGPPERIVFLICEKKNIEEKNSMGEIFFNVYFLDSKKVGSYFWNSCFALKYHRAKFCPPMIFLKVTCVHMFLEAEFASLHFKVYLAVITQAECL